MEHNDSHQPSQEGTDPATGSNAMVPHTPNHAIIASDDADAPGSLDAHGHDPALYDWVPVLKKRRADGWSPQKQRAFIEVLADTGSVSAAARAVGMSRQACYELRRSPGAENFDRAWEVARRASSRQLIDIVYDRAINGVEDPVFDKYGQRIACRYRYNDRLLMFLIRTNAGGNSGQMPEDDATDDCAPAPALPAPDVAAALKLLEPEAPPDPHLLMEPEELEDALFCANLLDGELPRWRRDAEVTATPVRTAQEAEIDRLLDDARRENRLGGERDQDHDGGE